MTQIGNVYGQALYALAQEEGLTRQILGELRALQESFTQEPDFLRLLSAHNLSKQERCQILDDSFRGNVHPYVLNFFKILTEKGYARHFGDSCSAYQESYNMENGILPVKAISAVPLSEGQRKKLSDKLARITGKAIELENRVDPAVLGGVRLDYDGKRVEDTIIHRLEAVRSHLKNTVL